MKRSNKMKNKLYIFLILISLITTSCRTVSSVQFQVLEPAKIILPQHVKKFSVVNNIFLQNKYDKIINKKKSKVDYRLFNIDKTKMKQLTTNLTVKYLTDMINDSPLYEKAVLVNNKKNIDSLNWENIKSICKKNKTDALISLEGFIHDDSVDFNSFYSNYGYVYYTYINFKVTTVWRIYYPQQLKVIDRDIQIGNVPFDSYGYSLRGSIRGMANDTAISEEIANNVANAFFRRISPAWTDCSRMYFTGSNNMRKAIVYVENNDWTKAAELWKIDVNNTNKRIAGDAAYNMALAAEMQGKLNVALVWAKKSFEKFNNKSAVDYIHILERRIKEQVKLNKQFAGEQVIR